MKFILEKLTKFYVDDTVADKYRIKPALSPVSFTFRSKEKDEAQATYKEDIITPQFTTFTGKRIYDTNEMKQSNDLYDHLLLLILQ